MEWRSQFDQRVEPSGKVFPIQRLPFCQFHGTTKKSRCCRTELLELWLQSLEGTIRKQRRSAVSMK